MTAHNGIRVRIAPGPRVIATVSELFVIPKPREWQEEGICASTDPDAFFPEVGGSNREAKAICRSCPVVEACLDYALDRGERFGIWGAKSERERRKMERDRRASQGLVRCRICDIPFDAGPRELDCSEECRAESRRRRNAKHRRTA